MLNDMSKKNYENVLICLQMFGSILLCKRWDNASQQLSTEHPIILNVTINERFLSKTL